MTMDDAGGSLQATDADDAGDSRELTPEEMTAVAGGDGSDWPVYERPDSTGTNT